MRELQPEVDDYVFTVEVERFISQYERVRRRSEGAGERASSRSGEWRSGSASARACGDLSPDQLRLALPTASCGRAVATSARFGRCLITRV
jgi:hypothetical protein